MKASEPQKHFRNADWRLRRRCEKENPYLFEWRFRVFIIILVCAIGAFLCYNRVTKRRMSRISGRNISDRPWDFLLFTQSYPITNCIWWKITKQTNCHFAMNKHAWTVHGIWPTKNNTEGPSDCRNIPFNETALEPIKSELEVHWLSVGGNNSDSGFWKHEWLKHGTCAVEDTLFDSELTYFKLGLKWNQQWNLTNILSNSGINPSDSISYSSEQFHDVVKSALGSGPYLACYYYEELGLYIINEIRLCISKDLELLDCDDLYSNYGNCPQDGIYYPDTLEIGRGKAA